MTYFFEKLLPVLLCIGAAWTAFSLWCIVLTGMMFDADMRREDERNHDANN